MLTTVFCLDDDERYYFVAETPYEALTKMKYTLDLAKKDSSATINKTESGKTLYMEHNEKTYSVINY